MRELEGFFGEIVRGACGISTGSGLWVGRRSWISSKLLRKRDIPEERYSNAFLGYGPEESHFAVELTYNYGVNKYDIGTGFGHFGIAVEDEEAAEAYDVAAIKFQGVNDITNFDITRYDVQRIMESGTLPSGALHGKTKL